MLRQSIYWRYLALSVLFSKTCHFYPKCCQRDWDARHETQREWDLWQADMHVHAHTSHTHAFVHKPHKLHARICTNTATNMHTPGFLWLLLRFISFSRSHCFFTVLNLWSHYLLTHLSSSKWFSFIFCKSPNQSWKPNVIQTSHCFQLHSLSLWKWMAAAENSDVLSHHDGVS